MKFCSKCGKQLDDQMMFCPGCGTAAEVPVPSVEKPLTVPSQEEKTAAVTMESGKTSKKKGKRKGKIVDLLCLSLLVIVLGIGGYIAVRWYFSDEQQLMRNLDSGDFDAAVELVESNVSLRVDEDLAEALVNRIEKIKVAFAEGKIEYSEIILEYDTIERFKVKKIAEDLEEAREYVEQLNQSKTCYNTAEEFFAAEDYTEAMEWYAQVVEEDSNYETARAKHTEAVNRYREQILAEAKQYASAEKYPSAISLLNAALKVIPEDAAVSEQITVYEKAYQKKLAAEALDEALQYANQENYAEAISVLEDAQRNAPNDLQIKEKLQEYQDLYSAQTKQNLLNGAKKLADEGDYANAIIMLKNNTDSEVRKIYNAYCGEYEKLILSEVDSLLGNKKYDKAISCLKSALNVIENHTAFTDKIIYIETIKPVSILKLIEINSSGWEDWNSGNPVDPFQNDYSYATNYCIVECYNGKDYIEYRTYRNYGTITGTISPYETMENGDTGYLQIYADDELVYTSPTITRKTDAFDFSVDISGAEYIKIYVCADGYSNWARVILSNFLIWP